ncbi:MAG TPA: serine hydrolase [Pseudolabrys sp.]|jgi:D-alanyl-D-alanine carboxypeptidase
MSRAGAFDQRRYRWSVLGSAALLAIAVHSTDADARARRHRQHHAPAAQGYEPSYSSLVVDANSGAVLQATNADSPRHPASLTKIMTLYLLFERLEAGKIKLSSELEVSAHAAAQAPSKLGLKPGQTINVETAIRAIVTKSANDVAVMVAEALAGDESEFAKLMTAKARALGMAHTTYRNASGLPEDQQITSARDQAILGRAIQDRFPKYYTYFSTRTFAFHGKVGRNHNHLLGSVDGVDGIKTGYIHDSGFNIIVSMRRGPRHLLAVVFGGRTASARDARVVSLLNNNINIAAVSRSAPPVVEGREIAEARAQDSKEAKDIKVASASPPPYHVEPVLGSTEPIKPNTVRTVQVSPVHTASMSPTPSDSRKLMPAPATANPASVTNIVVVKREPPSPARGAKPGVLGALPAKVASVGDSVPVVTAMPAPAAKPHSGGWLIQVGAFPQEQEAKQRLIVAQGKAKDQLAQANPFTERTAKGDKSLYRARFAGLDKDQAESACKHLKRSEIPCMLLKE